MIAQILQIEPIIDAVSRLLQISRRCMPAMEILSITPGPLVRPSSWKLFYGCYALLIEQLNPQHSRVRLIIPIN